MEYPEIFQRIKLMPNSDTRGHLTEIVNENLLFKLDIEKFPHILYVESHSNVIRGMHYQYPFQGKYIINLSGAVDIFGLDIRKDSPTFNQYQKIHALPIDHGEVYWLPPGNAFGYKTFTPTKLMYMASVPRSSDERQIQIFDSRWNHEKWALKKNHMNEYIMSKKDLEAELWEPIG